MGIINRDLDNTQKREIVQTSFNAVLATGVTSQIGLVACDSKVMSFFGSASGLSGAPVYSLALVRLASTGVTSIPCGATLTPPEIGVSGPVGFTLATGVTALRGDLLVVTSGVANTASLRSTFGAVLQPTADYKKYFGIA